MTEQELRSFWDSCDAQLKDMGAANSNNFDELAKHSFLPFIGAGMSAGFGYPVWTAFLRQEIRGYAPKEKQAELQKMLKEKQFLPLANALDQCTNNSIVRMVQDTFHPCHMRSIAEVENDYLKLLHKCGVCSYVTTNYDGVIEAHDANAQVILPTTCRTIQAFKNLDRDGQPFLLKLHGTYNDPGSVVLTEQQYQTHYPQDLNAPNPAALHHLWTTKVLLFLGCSLEKDYMVEQMFRLAGNSPEICHYAIVEWPKTRNRQKAKQRELVQLHIYPIWYPQGDHSCVCTILSMLAEGKGEPEPAKRLDPGGAAPKSSARLKTASWGDILPAEDFLGRESKKQELAEKLRTSDLVFLSGVGGIGKSELAAQYAREQAEAGKTVVRMFYHPGEPKAEDPVEASGLRKLSATNPSVYEPDVAMTCNNLATLLSDSPEGREEAEELYRESLELYRNLAVANPSVYESDVAMTCNNLATLLSDSPEGREEAEALYRESLDLRRNLAVANPSVYEPDVAGTCNNLANLLSGSTEGRAEAETLYREALALRWKQVRIAPEVYGPNLARVYRNLGRFLQSQGRTEEAEALFQEAKGE